MSKINAPTLYGKDRHAIPDSGFHSRFHSGFYTLPWWGQQPLVRRLGVLCYHERVQPTCEQSLRVGHAYTATLDQQGSGGLGLRASLVVGDALPF